MGTGDQDQRLAAEQRSRVLIDRQLRDAGWLVQHRDERNLFAGQGVAVREEIMAPGHGRADHLLYVDKRAVGVIEAWGSETHVTNGFDPDPRARSLFCFPRPATLARTLREAEADPARRRGGRKCELWLRWRCPQA